MQFISERFVGNFDITELDYSSVFNHLLETVSKTESNVEETPLITSVAMRSINQYSISIFDYQRMSLKDTEDCLDLLIELRDYLVNLEVDPTQVNISEVPTKFEKFFSIMGDIAMYKALSNIEGGKRPRHKIKTKMKKKMFF